MMLSRKCIYAIRAVLLLASKASEEERQYFSIQELASELNLSFHFLTKVLQSLTEARLLKSYRGPKGGIGFDQDVRTMRLIDIVGATDGLEVFEKCVLGLPECDEANPCPLHETWKQQRERIKGLFERTKVSTLASNLRGTRLAD